MKASLNLLNDLSVGNAGGLVLRSSGLFGLRDANDLSVQTSRTPKPPRHAPAVWSLGHQPSDHFLLFSPVNTQSYA